MKSIYLFCTRILAFWVELPLILIFVVSIIYNKHAEGFPQLYPLIIASGIAIIFFVIYFFRVIQISYAEIRYIGRFTSRDSAMIVEGRTIVLTLERFGRVGITLRGYDGPSELNITPDEDDVDDHEYTLFRGHCFGGKSSIRKILGYFGVSKEDINSFLSGEFHEKEYELVGVSSGMNEEERATVYIKINKTV